MKGLCFALIIFCCFSSFSQNKKAAIELVEIGINYHDKGDYRGAIDKYEEALKLDKDNFLALAEMAYSYIALEKYQQSVEYSQKAIQLHPDEPGLGSVYITLGNAYDGLLKTDKSIDVYDEGIKLFPNEFMLYFNKGITLSSVKRYKEAILCFEKSVELNPKHASSHNAIARVLYTTENKIPAILAYCRFFTLEQASKRAAENLASLQEIIKGNTQQTGKNTYNISLNADSFLDSAKSNKVIDDNFRPAELLLSLASVLDFDKKNKNKTPAELLNGKLETMFAHLSETKEDNKGFFWEYYVPYFTSMKEKGFIETFSHIILAASNDEDNKKWLSKHKTEVTDFYFWSNTYTWKKN